eukprot:5743243-Pyramimonas_sp.AAC.1
MLTLPRGTRQLASRVHMEAFQGGGGILARSIPSRDRRPLLSKADGHQAWTPENLDDISSAPDSEGPELEWAVTSRTTTPPWPREVPRCNGLRLPSGPCQTS